MTYKCLFLGAGLTALLLFTPCHAGEIQAVSTAQNTAWVGLDDDNPLSIDEDDPVTTLTTIPATGQIVAGPNSFTVGENSFGGPPPIPSQSFLATKSGLVQNVQMYISGAASTYDLHLYDVGAGAPAPTGVTSYTTALPDLLPANTFMRFFGSAGAVHTLDLLGAGINANLIKGHTYIWELVGLERDANGVLTGNNTAAAALTWFRNGGANSYLPNGQAFRSRSSLNGNPDRSFAMAAHLVPEPSTLMLFGLGMFGLVIGRRRGN